MLIKLMKNPGNQINQWFNPTEKKEDIMKKLIILCISVLCFSSAAYPANYITAVCEPQTLYGTDTSAKLWAKISPPADAAITQVWATIDLTGESVFLTDENNDGIYEAVYNNFKNTDSYMIVFYAKDSKNNESDPAASSVRKTASESDDYELDDEYSQSKIIVLEKFQDHNFHKSGDTDWVRFYGISGLHYKINVNNLSSISNAVIEIYDSKEIKKLKNSENSAATEGKPVLLEWDCPANGIYYVKFKDFTDSFGANVRYNVQISQPAAPVSGQVNGTVTDSFTKTPIGNVIITTERRSDISSQNGVYTLENHPTGTYMLTAEAEGYQTLTYTELAVTATALTKRDISLMPSGSVALQKGDLNKDKSVDLKDAIAALRVLAGLEFSGTYDIQADVNGDNRIGMEEAVYILQKVAGLR
ncbi:MAG: hypothetical protein BWK80_54595 [Desulfobacteraceae bacterium IS3]|nr:MAG: hypothetical protein BWK80_54595 [Desulfobacteraceae bacterium IS3]